MKPKSPTPNQTIGALSGATSPPLTKARNRQPSKARRTTTVLTLRSQRDLPGGRPLGIALTRRARLRRTGALPHAWPAPNAAAARPRLRRIAPRRAALAPWTGPTTSGASRRMMPTGSAVYRIPTGWTGWP